MKLAVIIDRAPDDPEWKGACAWNIILSLAESQHEVLALTPLDPASIDVAHPRLTVAQPARSFGLNNLPRWLRSVLQFQPDVIHTFALKPAAWKGMTIWPMLESTLNVWPRVRRYSTALSGQDSLPFQPVNAPLELGLSKSDADQWSETLADAAFADLNIIVPCPVSEWAEPRETLLHLRDFLTSNRDLHAHIVGGWGDTSLSKRREGWRLLENVNGQVHMGDPVSFPAFVELARNSRGLWLRGLSANSFRARVAAHLALDCKLPTWGEAPQLNVGSTANFLSRLYSLS